MTNDWLPTLHQPLVTRISANLISYSNIGWTNDLQAAATLFRNVPGAVSISWNNYLEKFIAVHSITLDNRVVMRTADNPEGPWSDTINLFTGKIPEEKDQVDYAGEQHPELVKNEGKKIYVSYFHPLPGLFTGELRLVEVEFK